MHKTNLRRYMNNEPVIREPGMGRYKIFTRQELKDHRREYVNKPWVCECCDNLNLKRSGKWCHLKSEQHRINYIKFKLQHRIT